MAPRLAEEDKKPVCARFLPTVMFGEAVASEEVSLCHWKRRDRLILGGLDHANRNRQGR
jgi:hypothetical protein